MVYLTEIFKFELILSTLLLILLIFLGIYKKDSIVSEEGLEKLNIEYNKFRDIYFLGVIVIGLFLALLIVETTERIEGVPIRSSYPFFTELLKVAMISTIIVITLVNLYVIQKMWVDGK